ncbi:CPBP family intramembrane glutamic endopeptidase [Flagellimonas sp. CMM7]|uniref:CPBP family intramembrane glutamic endopeptidase n=1 Tax=Flagellimonas sp. CMM7 TaxID=2654676 RepID=UPI0013D13317|nr:type II CAAX endopeptidase family protein [Flagellimonas sp. CMM7]UII81122.1 CPBP family intramembrane metalloprotease [Flagellimonas sp. CMM7]
MRLRNIIFNDRGNVRVSFRLLSFILLFQIIGILLIKIFVPFFKESGFYLSFMVNVLSCLAVLLALFIYSKYIDKSSFAKYGMYPGRATGIHFINGTFTGMACLWVVVVLQKSNSTISFEPSSIYLEYNIWIVYLSQALRYFVGSIFEEVLTTSFLFILVIYAFTTKSKWYVRRQWIAIMISALLFGLIHSSNQNANFLGIFNLILFGAITTINFARTRNLAFAIGFHSLWNFTQNVLFGLPNSGKPAEAWIFKTNLQSSDLISGGNFGLENSILSSGILIIILVYQSKRFKNSVQFNKH